MSVLEGLFPEVGAGGFTRMEQRIQFYSRVRALLEPDHHVLELAREICTVWISGISA